MSGPNEYEKAYNISVPVHCVHDERISAKAYRLFGFIQGFLCRDGYCWISNEKLAEQAKVGLSQLSVYLKELEDAGYIYRQTTYDGLKKTRKIWDPGAFLRHQKEIGFQIPEIAKPKASKDRNSKNVTVTRKIGRSIVRPIGHKLDISNNIYIKETTKEKATAPQPSVSEPAARLVVFFAEMIRRVNPKVKIPESLKKWEREMDLLLRKDNATEEEVKTVIKYLESTAHQPAPNGFCWANVVLSVPSLRDKFPRLWIEQKTPKNNALGKTQTAIAPTSMRAERNKQTLRNMKKLLENNNIKETKLDTYGGKAILFSRKKDGEGHYQFHWEPSRFENELKRDILECEPQLEKFLKTKTNDTIASK